MQGVEGSSINASSLKVNSIPIDSPFAGLLGFDAPDQQGGASDVSVAPDPGFLRDGIFPSSIGLLDPSLADLIDLSGNALSGRFDSAFVHYNPSQANNIAKRWPVRFDSSGDSIQCPEPSEFSNCNSYRCMISPCVSASIASMSVSVVAQLAEVELVLYGEGF